MGWSLGQATRDSILFLSGIVFAGYEVFFDHGPERPLIIGLIITMLGLPFAFKIDQKRGGTTETTTGGIIADAATNES